MDTVGATDGDAVGPIAVATAESIADPTAGATAEPLLLVKRQAPEAEPTGCILYRYGTFSTELSIIREHRAEGPGRGSRGVQPSSDTSSPHRGHRERGHRAGGARST